MGLDSEGGFPVTCAFPSGKFEDREDHVPKLEQINSTRILSSQNFSLTKKELLSTELLLLEAFSWNLCLLTPAHFLDYYLLASVSQKDHHCHSWPTTCPRKTKDCLKEYAHYFLEVTLQGGADVRACLPFLMHTGVGIRLPPRGLPPGSPCHQGLPTRITTSLPLCRDEQRRSKDSLPVLAITCEKEVAAFVQAAGSLPVYTTPGGFFVH